MIIPAPKKPLLMAITGTFAEILATVQTHAVNGFWVRSMMYVIIAVLDTAAHKVWRAEHVANSATHFGLLAPGQLMTQQDREWVLN